MNKDRFISIEEVILRVNRQKSWIYREIAADRFPKRYPNGWLERDIDKWIEELVATHSQNDDQLSAAA